MIMLHGVCEGGVTAEWRGCRWTEILYPERDTPPQLLVERAVRKVRQLHAELST